MKTTHEAGAAGDLYHQLGHLTRVLHDALGQLGVMPRLQAAAQGLPDARSRLNYVAEKTADAAHRVLNAVDAAKDDQRRLRQRREALLQSLKPDGQGLVPVAAVLAYVNEVESVHGQLDAHLTDIMMAQDFHDLTGQVVRKVLDVANTLEEGLVRLLVEAAGSEAAAPESPDAPSAAVAPADPSSPELQGPVVAGVRQGEVLSSQSEVDDLLSSLGF